MFDAAYAWQADARLKQFDRSERHQQMAWLFVTHCTMRWQGVSSIYRISGMMSFCDDAAHSGDAWCIICAPSDLFAILPRSVAMHAMLFWLLGVGRLSCSKWALLKVCA